MFQLQEVHRKLRVRLSGREVRHQHVLRLWYLHHGVDGVPQHGLGWAHVQEEELGWGERLLRGFDRVL